MACKRRVARFWVPLCLCGFVLSTTFVDHPSFNGSVLTPSRRREANVAKPRCTPRLASSGSIYTVRAANSAMMLLVAVTLLALKNQAALAWWVGFGLHALLSSIMRRFPFPTTIPASFRREARSNLAKSYIAQAILLSITFTSESLVPTLVSRYLLFALIFLTSIFFDWPDPPLLEQAPALVFPGAIPTKSEAGSGAENSATSRFIMRLVGILLLAKLLSSQTCQSALSWGAAFFAHCMVSFLVAKPKK